MTMVKIRIRSTLAAAGLLAVALPLGAALPPEVTITKPGNLELLRNGKVSGTVALPPGQKLDVIDQQGDYVLVRYRNLNGRVPVALTNFPHGEPDESEAPPPAAAVKSPATTRAAPASVAETPYTPATTMERVLAGKLVALDGGVLRPYAAARLAGVKFYAIYFSASWCPPCREFTPGFVDAYGKIRALYPELEVVLVNHDHSQADMLAYMRNDQMKWPALRWEDIKGAAAINRYAGEGIPCLVLVDENGKVLSDSFHGRDYVGPNAVVDDTWKILREYRRKNPRQKI
ncbi:MAG: redoxin domain-containing protein [Opitutaceae bacterium]|nr:redoxin domain-containing protein [Opitutaceae bacterium]